LINGVLYRQDNHQLLLSHVMRTTTSFERMRGLLGRPPLRKDQGLIISPCSAIHTFFMSYPLDLVFLNRNWQIKKLVPGVNANRIIWVPGASMVVELPGGVLENIDLTEGATLAWEEHQCA